jgi:hypothetical protein
VSVGISWVCVIVASAYAEKLGAEAASVRRIGERLGRRDKEMSKKACLQNCSGAMNFPPG